MLSYTLPEQHYFTFPNKQSLLPKGHLLHAPTNALNSKLYSPWCAIPDQSMGTYLFKFNLYMVVLKI